MQLEIGESGIKKIYLIKQKKYLKIYFNFIYNLKNYHYKKIKGVNKVNIILINNQFFPLKIFEFQII